MKLFATAALIAATVAGSSAFAMTAAPLSASIAYEVSKIVPGADLSTLTTSQVAELNGLFASTDEYSDVALAGAVKRVITAR